jgi:hypothetical protein
MGRGRDEEFADVFRVAWPRVYRTTYAVSGDHEASRTLLQSVFAAAYAEWPEVSATDDPEREVEFRAVGAALALPSPPSEFGPLVPYGSLIRALPEERAKVEALWDRFRRQPADVRAEIAMDVAAWRRSPNGLRISEPSDPLAEGLSEFLAAYLDEILVAEGDLMTVLSRGRARQRRRLWLTLGAAVLMVAMIMVPWVVWDRPWQPDEDPTPLPRAGRWEELPVAPLTPRWSALVTWTGEEVVVLGGHSEETCDDRGVCEELRDGAAYTPSTGRWRPLAPLPFGVAESTPSLQVGDTLVVVMSQAWWAYDAQADSWDRLPSPPDFDPAGLNNAAATDTEVYVPGRLTDDPIYAFNLAQRKWRVLPDTPLQPRLERRMLAATSAGLMVFGADSTGPPDDPFVFDEVYAQFYDGESWSSLPRSEQRAAACCWWWTGQRLVHLERMPVYLGEEGRKQVRFAGGMFFDIEKQQWGLLPEAPTSRLGGDDWSLFARGGPLIAFGEVLYDDRVRSWSVLSRPSQAPESGSAAAWMGDQLFAFGGANLDEGPSQNTDATNRAWVFTPPAPD